jgi:rubredoxin
MRALDHADFLSLWEKGRALHPLDQGLLAIHAAFPEASEKAADWPLGRRNRALAELHCFYFGHALAGWTSCPQCGEKLEFKMDGRALLEQARPHQAEPIVVHGNTFRLPTSRDLAHVAEERDALADRDTPAVRLLRACLMDGGEDVEKTWSEEELEEAGEKMAAADPLAEIVVNFQCPVCEGACQETLDLPRFLWAELEALARRLVMEVHTLASAYGWTESEILSLSDARRRLYLEMVTA